MSIKKFWEIYSLFYDTLNNFYPYRQLLETISLYIEYKENGILLDCGCGTGNLLEWLNKKFKIVALDNNYAMLRKALCKFRKEKINFVLADLETNLCFKDEQFDFIVSNNVLSYIKNIDLLLEEWKRILKTNGKFIISVPNKKFNIVSLFLLHLKKSSFLQIIKTIFPLLVLGSLNIFIYFQVIKKNFCFYSKEELAKKISQRFKIEEVNSSYGNQAVLIIGSKNGNIS